ncbi:MAG: C39 family peptidase [Oscillospiraceae bacterium]|nr:C39 family peptidase [Oscillospiraceae bacterium]
MNHTIHIRHQTGIFMLFLLFLLFTGTACAVSEDPELPPETECTTEFQNSGHSKTSTKTESVKQNSSEISIFQEIVTENSENLKNSESSETIPETSEIPDVIEIPESILLEDVPYYSQEYILPTGCEIVSAKMLLEYYSHQETEIDDMLSVISCQSFRQEHGRLYAPHPEDAFIGNPYSESGYGCFAPVIVRMLNHLLPKQYRAVDTSGTDLQELAQTYLPQGMPVLVWATIGMWNPSPTTIWYLYNSRGYATDHQFQWLANEHCMVLIGYDADYYYFQDPYESNGTMKFRKDISEKRHEEIGSYSVVVMEKSEQSK